MSRDQMSIGTAIGRSSVDDCANKLSDSTSNILNYPKTEKHMQWWLFGPVVLAIVMFLLMGTIFERRIEAFWRHILARRQAVLSQQTDCTDPPLATNSLHTVKTPSQRTIASNNKDITTTTGDNENKLESKSLNKLDTRSFTYAFGIKDYKDEPILTQILKS